MHMELVGPDKKYEASFLDACQEYREDPASMDQREARVDPGTFDTYLSERQVLAQGTHLAPGQIRTDTYWAVEDGAYVGTVKVRPVLTPAFERLGGHVSYLVRPSKRGLGYAKAMLRLALRRLHNAGVTTAIVTVTRDNIASQRVVASLGGTHVAEFIAEGGEVVDRYELDTQKF